jgi:hypothetical protein
MRKDHPATAVHWSPMDKTQGDAPDVSMSIGRFPEDTREMLRTLVR